MEQENYERSGGASTPDTEHSFQIILPSCFFMFYVVLKPQNNFCASPYLWEFFQQS